MSEYSPRACIPTGPIVERIHQWVEAHNYLIGHGGEPAGGAEACMEMCGINISTLERQKMMTFDTADRILCKLGFEQDWYFHPVLAPIYDSLRLRPNEQDLRIEGDEAALAKFLRQRAYAKVGNARRRGKLPEVAPTHAPSRRSRAALVQSAERYDVLEAA